MGHPSGLGFGVAPGAGGGSGLVQGSLGTPPGHSDARAYGQGVGVGLGLGVGVGEGDGVGVAAGD